MRIEMVAFQAAKQGNDPADWEDGARYDEATGPGQARLIIVDGATAAFDVHRWVDLLVESFVPPRDSPDAAPEFERESLRSWLQRAQESWRSGTPTEHVSVMAAQKYRTTGAFATILGCEISGLDGQSPLWRAVSVGDCVLFHVRDWALLTSFPALTAEQFDNRPNLVHTDPHRLDAMCRSLEVTQGALREGDLLFAATDALAHWIIRMEDLDERVLWRALASITYAPFCQLVDARRDAGELKNDDVTLVRAVVRAGPSPLAGR